MKLINPSFEIIRQENGVEGIYKQVELAGRTCYKTEDKITEGSARKFVDMITRSGHGAMLEHGTVYLAIPRTTYAPDAVCFYENNHYSRVSVCKDYVFTDKYGDKVAAWCVTTNLRVLEENDLLDDLEFLCDPTPYHEKRVTVKFTLDRITGESFLRHREVDEDHPTLEGEVTREMEKDINSFARESTRYCNYGREKFGKELSIVMSPDTPEEKIIASRKVFADDYENDFKVLKAICEDIANLAQEDNQYIDFSDIDLWLFANLATQYSYMGLLSKGWSAERARIVLPFDIKSPLVMTAFISDWEHYFELRCANDAHPQARELAIPLRDVFIKDGLIKPVEHENIKKNQDA